MRTDPRPEPGAMASFYPADYAPFRPVPRRSSGLAGALRRVCPSLMQSVPPMSPGRLLELGCASGDFLDRLRNEGWAVVGVEPSADAAGVARGRGFVVHQDLIESVELDVGERFDLIAAWMVLEHTHDPVVALTRARDWAKPGAALALSVPDAGSAEFSVFRDAWYALQLPTHLFHFTPATLRNVLQRAGWRVERIQHQRTLANAAVSVGYRLEDHGRAPRLSTLLQGFPASHAAYYATYPLARLAALFGQTGRITVWARAT
jgi:SAM-dependent methyltransferase